MQFDLFSNLQEDIGDSEGKNCRTCNRYLPLESFEWYSGTSTWRRPECRKCRGEKSRTRNELKKYAPPITEDHTCPICTKNLEEISLYKPKSMKTFVLDHDHEKKMFRGWLCSNCNVALGMLDENLETIKRAYNYLKEFKDDECS